MPGQTVEAFRHEEAKRRNIPTACQSVLEQEAQCTVRAAGGQGLPAGSPTPGRGDVC